MPKNSAKLTAAQRQPAKTDKVVENLPRGMAKQAGTSLTSSVSTNINGFLYNPEANFLQEYERALTTDDAVGSAIDFTVMSLSASLGEYMHKRPEIRRFVRDNLNSMVGNFRQAIAELAKSGLWSGFGTSEIIWTVEGRSLWIERLANYHPRTMHFSVDINGYLRDGGEAALPGAFDPGIYQLSPYKGFGTYNKIPVSKTCVITHNQRHGNVYGESSIRRVYKHWKYKDAILEMWATALDRYGTPVTWMKVPRLPTGRVIQDPYAEGGVREEMMADSASAAIAGIHGGTGLVVENPDPNNDVDLGTLTTGNNYGTSFMDYLNHIDRAVYRGLLIPQTIFHENAGGGINNTSKTHFEVFKLMIRALYMQFVEPFVEQVIGRLIRYNFNETDPGYFEFLPFDASMADLLATMLEKMVNMGAVDTSDLSDLNMVRSMVGLSPREKPAIQNIGQVVKDYEAELRSKEKVAEIRAEASIEQAAMRSHSLEHAAEIRVDGPNAPSSPDSVEMHEEEANASVGKKTGKGTPKTGAKKSSFRGQSTKDLVAQAKATAKSVRANKPVKLSLGEALSVPEYPPEVVVAVIMDGNGRILLMRRSATESNRAKEWETPGGHLEPGETIQAAAQREILEETGLTIHEIGAYALRFELRDGEGYGLMVGAKAAQGNNNIQMDLAEHDRYEWVWPEDLGDFDPVPPNFVANVTQVWEANMFTATP